MSVELTIAYITCRLRPRIDWFFNSLKREEQSSNRSYNLIVVDGHFSETRFNEFDRMTRGTFIGDFLHVPPKPSPWAGPGRLTKRDWFRAASARNTALCLTRTPYLAYVDDLSVILPGWLERVKSAIECGRVTAGAYRKVLDLHVDNEGRVTSFRPHLNDQGRDIGTDSRFAQVTGQEPVPCNGDWLFGCSAVFPVEALLNINGWPEDLCDGHGFEDSLTGIVLQNAGYQLHYDKRMMTYESEEGHHNEEETLGREDYGKSPNDKSHAALAIAKASRRFHNSINMREVRDRVFAGGEFPPVDSYPDCEWYTKRHLSEL